MRTTLEGDHEYWVLTTDTGQALLAEAAATPVPRPADYSRWCSRATIDQVAAAIRLAEGRKRGLAKYSRAGRMWFEKIGLEQSTAEPVARHKAQRFAGRTATVIDLCCGIGGDSLALASWANVVSVDSDASMCRRSLWNASVYEVRDRVFPVQARAETIEIPRGAWVHIDPDRRVRSITRARRIDEYSPGLDFLLNLPKSVEGGAIKVSPASDFEPRFPRDGFEVELVSLKGECKEATIWFGAAVTCARRATVLPQGETWTNLDGTAHAAPPGGLSRYVFDPDPSLARVSLLDGFATIHQLHRYAPGIDFLTGDRRVETAFLSAFEVLAELPLDLKRLKREVASRGIGALEVKTKGLDLIADQLRARLQGREGPPATLLLSGGMGPARAIIARRV